MTSRLFAAVVLTSMTLSTGCVRRAVTHDFGLSGINATRVKRPSPPTPDSSLRALFKKQTIQTLNSPSPVSPVTDAERVEILREHVRANPQDVTAWLELGLLYERLSDLAGAGHTFEEALALNPESDRLHNNLGYSLLLQNKTEAAERELRQALELNPSSATARNNLGALLARRGDTQLAFEQFQMTADPATAHNNLAVVLLEMGRYEESREELVKALAIRRSFAPALANFKLVQERIHERAELQKFPRLPLSVVRVNTLRTDNENILDSFLERN
jgi:Flp pilus assembly protein TadD